MDNHSWCYASCIQCHKKIDVYTEPFVCPCGKHNDRVVLRFLFCFLNFYATICMFEFIFSI